jgi:3-oxoacyl-[acyl-carrier-protein] synthase I
LLSPGPCKPFDVNRDGISIGEAAAFGLLERDFADAPADAIRLLGIGESSDAHHMSSPHPEGLGARLAMEQALASAGLNARDIGYVNLHGTATPSNDAAESCALVSVFGDGVPCNSTKGLTGHTLGAAGAIEAVIAALALRHQRLPAGANTTEPDAALGLNYVLESRETPLDAVLSNSFGFGGTNCSLVLGRGRRGQTRPGAASA